MPPLIVWILKDCTYCRLEPYFLSPHPSIRKNTVATHLVCLSGPLNITRIIFPLQTAFFRHLHEAKLVAWSGSLYTWYHLNKINSDDDVLLQYCTLLYGNFPFYAVILNFFASFPNIFWVVYNQIYSNFIENIQCKKTKNVLEAKLSSNLGFLQNFHFNIAPFQDALFRYSMREISCFRNNSEQ